MLARLLYVVFFVVNSLTAFAQRPKTQETAIILKRQIERLHFSPKAVNDSFSSEMFAKIIKELDPRQNILTVDDYTILSDFRYKLDDELNGAGWKFIDLVSNLYKQRLKRADSLAELILQKPLDLSVEDKITFSKKEDFQFALSPAELRTRWTKWFKFQMLGNIYDLYGTDSVKTDLKTLLAKNESTIRDKIKKRAKKNIQAILDTAVYDNYLKETYYNALATTFDPHTMFFSPKDKENFQSELSTENFSLGFNIDETREGKIVVAGLIPGGPAWRTGEMHVDDELLQLQWEGKQLVDVSAISFEEADELLNESNHGTITLKMKKTNGAVYSIALQKEKIETQENVVKGYVFSGEKKIGYLSLPDFYTNWEDENGSGCANDLAKEIVRLKRENIEGLILDIRFNGGGSLGEALELAGIFIDEGPLTGTKERTGKLVFLKDPNRGTIYDGPLVVLINGQSASASELVAAVLQDYNRAVIVGSPSYGKATMQQIFPVDTLMKNPNAHSENGYVKITDGKLYRVTGQTAQLNGVIPDIPLPDAFDALKYGERFTPDVLLSDTVKRNAYYKPLSPLPVSQLNGLSNQRVNTNKNFQELKEAIRVEKQLRESTERVVPLKLELFQKWADANKSSEVLFGEKENASSKIFTAQNHRDEVQHLLRDSYAKTINEIILKNIQQDIYIEEAYQITIDLIKMQPKN
ncbi:MAG TPA: carboxy terminal-processing peptidase [Flavisolibacter sp.]|nr:carboxy terminal-processing peptidase [Flavisolibacter sp.]